MLSKTHKTSKTSGKREKIACVTIGHLPKLKNIKNGGLREWRREGSGWCMEKKPKTHGHFTLATLIYKIVIISCRIIKMPLLGL